MSSPFPTLASTCLTPRYDSPIHLPLAVPTPPPPPPPTLHPTSLKAPPHSPPLHPTPPLHAPSPHPNANLTKTCISLQAVSSLGCQDQHLRHSGRCLLLCIVCTVCMIFAAAKPITVSLILIVQPRYGSTTCPLLASGEAQWFAMLCRPRWKG